MVESVGNIKNKISGAVINLEEKPNTNPKKVERLVQNSEEPKFSRRKSISEEQKNS